MRFSGFTDDFVLSCTFVMSLRTLRFALRSGTHLRRREVNFVSGSSSGADKPNVFMPTEADRTLRVSCI